MAFSVGSKLVIAAKPRLGQIEAAVICPGASELPNRYKSRLLLIPEVGDRLRFVNQRKILRRADVLSWSPKKLGMKDRRMYRLSCCSASLH